MARSPPKLPNSFDDLREVATAALAQNVDDAATIAEQKLVIAKLKRQIYRSWSERSARLIEQMELGLEGAGTHAKEAECASERAITKSTAVKAFERKRPSRRLFPARGRCGAKRCDRPVLWWRARKLGETVTETLEVIPR